MTDISNVTFAAYHGGGNFSSWIAAACEAADVPFNDNWHYGMHVLCLRESSLKPNAVNTIDKNANGPIVADGHPQNCSRGLAQCIPSTFAEFHAPGTSWDIYDPIANLAASITYIIDHYHMDVDGSNLTREVQQADAHRLPHGYIEL